MFAFPLEFKLVEREVPSAETTSGSGTRRGKIKEHDTPKWTSTWIPWDDTMDVTSFLRNLQRELAAVGLAATRDVDKNMRARMDEYRILNGMVSSSSHDLMGGPRGSSSSMKMKKPKRARLEEDGEEEDIDDDDVLSDADDGFNDVSARRSSAKMKKSSKSFMISPGGSADGSARKTSAAPASTMKASRPCPDCDEPIEFGEPQCPKCGVDFSIKGKGGVLGKGKKLCRNCSAIIPSSKKSCPVCQVPCLKAGVTGD